MGQAIIIDTAPTIRLDLDQGRHIRCDVRPIVCGGKPAVWLRACDGSQLLYDFTSPLGLFDGLAYRLMQAGFQLLAGRQVGVRGRESIGQLVSQLQDGITKLFDVIGAVVLHGANLDIPRRTSSWRSWVADGRRFRRDRFAAWSANSARRDNRPYRI